MKLIPNAIARKVAQQGFLASQKSPSILFGAGVVGMLSSTVLACRATLKLDEILENTQRELYQANEMRGFAEEASTTVKYSDSDLRQDKAIIIGRCVGHITKSYAPSLLLGAASVGCLTKSHNILQERNLAVTAAYAALDEAFKKYRERVVDEYGEDVDRQMRYESETVDIVDGETGKVVSTTRVDVDGDPSGYAVFFDEFSSRNWSVDPDVNLLFLRSKQNYLNDRLKVRGHMFLNEVYDELGLPQTKGGALVGWLWHKHPGDKFDNFIDFGIWDGQEVVNDFFNGREGAILLDFNVDGIMYDKLETDR